MEEIIHRAQDIIAQIEHGYNVEYIRSHYTDEEQVQYIIKAFENYIAHTLAHGRGEEIFSQLKQAAIEAGFNV